MLFADPHAPTAVEENADFSDPGDQGEAEVLRRIIHHWLSINKMSLTTIQFVPQPTPHRLVGAVELRLHLGTSGL